MTYSKKTVEESVTFKIGDPHRTPRLPSHSRHAPQSPSHSRHAPQSPSHSRHAPRSPSPTHSMLSCTCSDVPEPKHHDRRSAAESDTAQFSTTQQATVASCTPHPDELYLPAGTQVQGYYVVTVGQEVGIFFAVRIDGISGASHTRYDHWADMLELYMSHYNTGLLHAVPTVGGSFWPVGIIHPTPPPSPTTTTSSTNSEDLWSYLEDLSEHMSQV
ncbi:uncharacterized protein EDB91DRAFT_1249035 [Suillus paluster]|uniref:uncharacterized protein n=1 Tax=Suillus paluster TaxID=48578 RepID=UPI001B87A713|nr:uncharacterized protein EDB91DRAFT_1249035 [Suillus paluster]KAG1738867.1 hypothetical protein EDB91DRAFT_1249035 [Suillus paluster]